MGTNCSRIFGLTPFITSDPPWLANLPLLAAHLGLPPAFGLHTPPHIRTHRAVPRFNNLANQHDAWSGPAGNKIRAGPLTSLATAVAAALLIDRLLR